MRGARTCWLIVVCSLAGCWRNGQPTTKPNQDRAVAIVWQDVFLRGDGAPVVRWVEGHDLTCTDPGSGRPGFPTPNGCREGLTMLPTEVQVAWRDDDSFSTTTLAHELLHAFHLRLGIMDPQHETPGFAPKDRCPGPPSPPQDLCGILEVANSALAAASL